MKKVFTLLVISLVLVLASPARTTALLIPPVQLAQGDSVIVNCPSSLQRKIQSAQSWTILCQILATLTPTHTSTPLPPTATRTVTPPAPSATAPTFTAVAGHDITRWHTITDHEHGDDPNSPGIVAVFGPAGNAWNGGSGQNIGVPFATSAIENREMDKHRMAKYYTMTRAQKDAAGYPCGREDLDTNATDNSLSGNNCVAAWRILVHGGGNIMESMSNNHSVFTELLICSRSSNYQQCGIFRSGGWIFWGKLQSPFYNQVFERSGGTFNVGGMTMTFKSDAEDLAAIGSPNTVFDDWSGEPYWFVFPNAPGDLTYYRNNPTSLAGDQFSSNEVSPYNYNCAPFPAGCGNNIFHLAVRVFDGWNLLDTTNIYNPIFLCTQTSPSNCSWNGSHRGMKEVQAYISPDWDQASFDTDIRVGYVSFSRYTDRYQRLRPIGACSVIGVDCVPLVLTGVPISYASVKLDIAHIEPGIDREYDTCRPARNCISFPN